MNRGLDRQSCAIESAAKWNPKKKVFVLFASPRVLDGTEPKHVQALMQYKNIVFRNVDLWAYAKGTPIEDWMEDNVLFTSDYVNFHMSDLLRYLRCVYRSWDRYL